MFKNLNCISLFILIFLPVVLVFLSILYTLTCNSLGWLEVMLFLVGYYISNIVVGIGLHRLWSHGAYKTNKYIEFVFALLSAGTLQGPALSWVSNHFNHHTYTDTKDDPHTPQKYKESKLIGFLWSHMGWMLVGKGSYKSISRITLIKLGKNKILRWQLKYYWQVATIMNTIIPALIGLIIGRTTTAAYAGFLFIGLGRAIQQQATFFVNSLCHFTGTQKYTNGTSGDIWWLALILLGENWHNFHHAFPSDYRNGVRWYHTDVHKWIIYLMSKCGLAWDLKRTAKIRINTKINQTMLQIITLKEQRIISMKNTLDKLNSTYINKFIGLENSLMQQQISTKCWKSLSSIQYIVLNLKSQLCEHIKACDNPPSDIIIGMLNKKIQKIELALQKIYLEIEKITPRLI